MGHTRLEVFPLLAVVLHEQQNPAIPDGWYLKLQGNEFAEADLIARQLR